MNAKLCKRLRKQARELAKDKDWPDRELLETKVHAIRYPWLVKTNPINGVVIDMGVRRVSTLVNNPQSARGAYRALKHALKG